MTARARVTLRPLNQGTESDRPASEMLATTCLQVSKESLIRATRESLGEFASAADSAGVWPEPPIALQSVSFDVVSWAMIAPKLIWAGVGLKPYLSAGMRSAAPGMLVE